MASARGFTGADAILPKGHLDLPFDRARKMDTDFAYLRFSRRLRRRASGRRLKYRVRGWHYCHRPPLRTVLATFAAHGSSISNALFGGRGTTTEAFCGISLPVQLHMTNRMHHNQIGH